MADDDPRDLKIRKELQETTIIDIKNCPIVDVADYLSDLHGIPIYFDTEEFEKAGVVYDKLEFTQTLKGPPLWRVLRVTLGQDKLSFMIKHHTLTITTDEAAEDWQKKNIGVEK